MIPEFKNIREIVENSSKVYSERLAFKIKHKNGKDFTYEDVTFSRLRKDVESLGTYLLNNNYQDKKIVIVGKNSYEWMVVYLATLSINAVIVPIDRMLPENEFADQLIRSEAALIFHDKTFDGFFEAHSEYTHINTESEEFKELLKNEASEQYKNVTIDCDKTSLLLFTSGTTSQSKAVMLSHGNIASNVYALTLWEKFYPEDVNMAFLPFHHSLGMTQMVLFIANGMCNVFCEGLRIAKCLNEYNISTLVCVPRIVDEIKNTIFSKLESTGKLETVKKALKLTAFLKKFGIDIRRKVFKDVIAALGGSLRMIIVGAAPASPETLEFFNGIGILTVQGYGLTETSPVISAENDTHMRKGSVGLALPGVEVKIVDKDENGIGEIVAKGPNIMKGYYKNDEANAAVFHDGYFHTGDMGYVDKDNFIFITGRRKNVIVLSNGKNVFPEELEALICECDAVSECVVYENKEEADTLSAKIVHKRDVERADAEKKIAEAIESLNNRVVHYKQIKSYEVTDVEFEKTTTLKIKR